MGAARGRSGGGARRRCAWTLRPGSLSRSSSAAPASCANARPRRCRGAQRACSACWGGRASPAESGTRVGSGRGR
eukprot:13472994-Alexandrium_andersonii.AAC.1